MTGGVFMTHNNGFDTFSMEQAMAFAASPAGQQLIAMLQSKGGTDFSKVRAHAAAGDMEQVKKELSSLLQDPKIKDLLKQFGG